MDRNVRLALIPVGIVVTMLGLSFASKPLYDTFCRVTGFGGTTRIAETAPDRILDRQVTIRFDSNVNNVGLKFRPLKNAIDARLGEHALAYYEVTNTSDQAVGAIASYNVTPHKVGQYFNKLDCFCFTERVFQPGETKKLPVLFFISPDMDDRATMDDVRTITLSYTFYESDSFAEEYQAAELNR